MKTIKSNKIFKGLMTISVLAIILVMMISPSNFISPIMANGDSSQVSGKAGSLNQAASPGKGTLTLDTSTTQNALTALGKATVSQLPAPQTSKASSASPKVIPFLAGPSNVAPQSSTKSTVNVVSVDIPKGTTSTSTAPNIANNYFGFEGVDYPADCFCTPPDGNLAAGPNDIMQVVNLDAEIWDKTGTSLAVFDLNAITGTGTDFVSDPRVVYDPQSGHWFVSILGVPSSGNGYVALAVSQSTDPTGSWCFYHLGTTNIIPDQPRMAVSDDKITLVSSEYTSDSGPFTGEEIWWLNKAPTLTCGSVGFQHFGPDNTRFHIEPAVHTVAGDSDFWYIQDGAGGATGAEFLHASGPEGSISFVSAFTQSIGMTNGPPGGAQPGTSTLVATNDARILSASINGGTIAWTANDACIPPSDSVTHSCIRWDIESTGGVLDQDLDFGQLHKDLYYPAVSQDAHAQEFGLIFDYSSLSEFPSIGFTGKSQSEPFNFVDPPVVVKVGTGDDLTGRHGDFHSIRYDSSTGKLYAEAEYNTPGLPWNTFVSINGISAGTSAPDPSTLAINPISNVPWGVSFGVTGKLTDNAAGGVGLGGMPITFIATGGNVLSTVTNPDGTFSTVGGAPGGTPPVSVTITGNFAGTTSHAATTGSQSYQTIKHTPTIETILFTAVPWNHLQYFSAEALDASTGGVLAGKMLTWTGSAVSVPTSATTDSYGFAESTKTATLTVGSNVNDTAKFAGDSFYFPATGNTVVYFQFRHFVGITLWTPANVTSGAGTTFGATLVDTAYNTNALPVAGATITFSGTGVSGGTIVGTTNANGDVIVHGVAPGTAGTWTVKAAFAGNTQYQPITSITKNYHTS